MIIDGIQECVSDKQSDTEDTVKELLHGKLQMDLERYHRSGRNSLSDTRVKSIIVNEDFPKSVHQKPRGSINLIKNDLFEVNGVREHCLSVG